MTEPHTSMDITVLTISRTHIGQIANVLINDKWTEMIGILGHDSAL